MKTARCLGCRHNAALASGAPMRVLRCCIAAVSLITVLPAGAATLPGPVFPSFQTAAALKDYCERGLARAKASLTKLEGRPADAHWIAAYDDLNALIEDWAGPIYLLSNVHPQDALREGAEACELRWQDFTSSLGQNEILYRTASRLRPRDAIDALLLKTLREDFEDAGVSLPPDKRRRAKTINDRLTALQLEFERNVRDANVRVALPPEALRG